VYEQVEHSTQVPALLSSTLGLQRLGGLQRHLLWGECVWAASGQGRVVGVKSCMLTQHVNLLLQSAAAAGWAAPTSS
jgi:hypothetical protein